MALMPSQSRRLSIAAIRPLRVGFLPAHLQAPSQNTSPAMNPAAANALGISFG